MDERRNGQRYSTSANYGRNENIILNEDREGELVLAFEVQKRISRQLEDLLHVEKNRNEEERSDKKMEEITQLRYENAKLKNILAQNLGDAASYQYLREEIPRLTAKILDSYEKYDAVVKTNQELLSDIQMLNRRLQYFEGQLVDPAGNAYDVSQTPQPMPRQVAERSLKEHLSLQAVSENQHEYLGMFEFKEGDEQIIMKKLVTELEPSTAAKYLPGLPAYVLIMCIRFTDHINDENLLLRLLHTFVESLKNRVKDKALDLELQIMWLANTLRLIHNINQYSEGNKFRDQNTPKQNNQQIRRFSLKHYHNFLAAAVNWIIETVITILLESLLDFILPAILIRETINGEVLQRPQVMPDAEGKPQVQQEPLDKVLTVLSHSHQLLTKHGVDPPVISQLYQEIFHFIAAKSFNVLVSRQELCHLSKGMQILYNLFYLEQWARDVRIPELLPVLNPIKQVALLLHCRKTEADVESICNMCDSLTRRQIIHVLSTYTPTTLCGENKSPLLVKAVSDRLLELSLTREREEGYKWSKNICTTRRIFLKWIPKLNQPEIVDIASEQSVVRVCPPSFINMCIDSWFKCGYVDTRPPSLSKLVTLFMDAYSGISFRIDHQPSSIPLEEIEIPDELNLTELRRI